MLKINVDGKVGTIKLEIDGTLADIAADTLIIISELYEMFEKKDKRSAEKYFEIISDNLKYVRDKESLKKDAEDAIKRKLEKNKKDTKDLEEISKLIDSMIDLLKKAEREQDEE